MRKKSKSIIPQNLQVPVMIVSAILFAIILWWRFAPASNNAASVPEAEVALVASNPGAMEELNAVIGRIRVIERPTLNQVRNDQVLDEDPFHWSGEAVSESTPERVTFSPESTPGRQELELTGVLLDSRGGLALINGRYVRTGERVDGCTVRAIGETSVSIEDATGLRQLYLPEVTLR